MLAARCEGERINRAPTRAARCISVCPQFIYAPVCLSGAHGPWHRLGSCKSHRAFGFEHIVAGDRQSIDLLCKLDLEHDESFAPESHLGAREIELPHPAEPFIVEF